MARPSAYVAQPSALFSCSVKIFLTNVIHWITFVSMNTVVELPEFLRRAGKLLKEKERESIVSYLAAHPAAGGIMRGTGGIRKLRWKRDGTGKSGGVRVIYYFHDDRYPLFLITIFSKSEKANLKKAERNELAKLTRILIDTYRRHHG